MSEAPDFEVAMSAELDGELDAYASELGVDVDELRARMTAQPGAADHLAALTGARNALGAPVPPLDNAARARLLSATRSATPSTTDIAARRRPRSSHAFQLVAAAAMVVLVVGGGAALLARTGTDNRAKSASKNSATGAARSGNLGDLGALDQRKLDRLLRGPRSQAAPPEAGRDRTTAPAAAGDSSRQSSSQTSGQPVEGFDSGGTVRATPEQVAACVAQYAPNGTARFTGTGAYKGQAAVVVAVGARDRTIVFVLAAADCNNVLLSVSR